MARDVNVRLDSGDKINIADFLPADPQQHFNQRQRYNNDELWKIRDMLGIMCQILFTFLCLYALFFLYEVHGSRSIGVYQKSEELQNNTKAQLIIPMHCNMKSYHMFKTMLNEIKALKQHAIEVAIWRERFVEENKKMVDEKISHAIEMYDADKIGLIDFAMESRGGTIISTPDTIAYPSRILYNVLGVLTLGGTSSPRLLIQSTVLPGTCFAFHGARGTIRIRLSQKVKIFAVSIDHVDKRLVTDLSSAPKDFIVKGLEDETSEGKQLGEFSFDIEGKTLQTFWIDKRDQDKSYELVELNILTNYGNEQYTCVYRFRVHGVADNSDNNSI